jgi:hypothetical protein
MKGNYYNEAIVPLEPEFEYFRRRSVGHFSIQMTHAEFETMVQFEGNKEAVEKKLVKTHKRIWITDHETYFPMDDLDWRIQMKRHGSWYDPMWDYCWMVGEQEVKCAIKEYGSYDTVIHKADDEDIYLYIHDAHKFLPAIPQQSRSRVRYHEVSGRVAGY